MLVLFARRCSMLCSWFTTPNALQVRMQASAPALLQLLARAIGSLTCVVQEQRHRAPAQLMSRKGHAANEAQGIGGTTRTRAETSAACWPPSWQQSDRACAAHYQSLTLMFYCQPAC